MFTSIHINTRGQWSIFFSFIFTDQTEITLTLTSGKQNSSLWILLPISVLGFINEWNDYNILFWGFVLTIALFCQVLSLTSMHRLGFKPFTAATGCDACGKDLFWRCCCFSSLLTFDPEAITSSFMTHYSEIVRVVAPGVCHGNDTNTHMQEVGSDLYFFL